MGMKLTVRRLIVSFISLLVLGFVILQAAPPVVEQSEPIPQSTASSQPAIEALENLAVKGRAPKTDYSREQFGNGWSKVNGCETRNIILYRDLENPILDEGCRVVSGTLHDPYTGKIIEFNASNGSAVQIDHVVALSDAWQKGAQQLSREIRIQLANDPLELIAADGPANQQKGDGDAATWLPANKPFRCEYVARQITVKQKYGLWVTQAEKDAIRSVLSGCPNQPLAS